MTTPSNTIQYNTIKYFSFYFKGRKFNAGLVQSMFWNEKNSKSFSLFLSLFRSPFLITSHSLFVSPLSLPQFFFLSSYFLSPIFTTFQNLRVATEIRSFTGKYFLFYGIDVHPASRVIWVASSFSPSLETITLFKVLTYSTNFWILNYAYPIIIIVAFFISTSIISNGKNRDLLLLKENKKVYKDHGPNFSP